METRCRQTCTVASESPPAASLSVAPVSAPAELVPTTHPSVRGDLSYAAVPMESSCASHAVPAFFHPASAPWTGFPAFRQPSTPAASRVTPLVPAYRTIRDVCVCLCVGGGGSSPPASGDPAAFSIGWSKRHIHRYTNTRMTDGDNVVIPL